MYQSEFFFSSKGKCMYFLDIAKLSFIDTVSPFCIQISNGWENLFPKSFILKIYQQTFRFLQGDRRDMVLGCLDLYLYYYQHLSSWLRPISFSFMCTICLYHFTIFLSDCCSFSFSLQFLGALCIL